MFIDDGGLIEISNTQDPTGNTGLFVEDYGLVEVGNIARMVELNDIIVEGPDTSVNLMGEVWIGEDLTIDGGGAFSINTPGTVVVGDTP